MLKLIAFSKKRTRDLENFLTEENLRKKSHNMIYAGECAREVLATHPTLRDFDIIFCTGEGEIAQTFEYYKNLANGERARPQVFQNSLHNSTLGALSLLLSKAHSGITISNGDISCEMALDLALTSYSSRPVLIIGTDVYNDKISGLRTNSYGNNVELESGACAGLFLPENHPHFDSINGPVINDIQITKRDIPTDEKFSSYYPSNGLEAIVLGLTCDSFILDRPTHYQVQISAQTN